MLKRRGKTEEEAQSRAQCAPGSIPWRKARNTKHRIQPMRALGINDKIPIKQSLAKTPQSPALEDTESALKH
jgi:hypothetical protein